MEISVGFADKDKTEDYFKGRGYIVEKTELGNCYYPSKGVTVDNEIQIIYEDKPWLSAFKVKGIKPSIPVRKGPGRKTARDFIPDILEIYPLAVEKMKEVYQGSEMEFGMDLYYISVADDFIKIGELGQSERKGSKNREKASMFYGFVENLWRDGDIKVEEMLKISLLPKLLGSDINKDFMSVISKEFSAWIVREIK